MRYLERLTTMPDDVRYALKVKRLIHIEALRAQALIQQRSGVECMNKILALETAAMNLQREIEEY
jgi:hypothetical protein